MSTPLRRPVATQCRSPRPRRRIVDEERRTARGIRPKPKTKSFLFFFQSLTSRYPFVCDAEIAKAPRRLVVRIRRGSPAPSRDHHRSQAR